MSISKNTNFSYSDDKVTKKGSGFQILFGVLLLIMSIWIKISTEIDVIIIYILLLFGIILIASSFLIIINQYERAIILRLGLYKKQIRPGIHTRIPLVDSVLVIDIRERVREFNAERMLTKDNVPVTIDAILRYKIMEERAE